MESTGFISSMEDLIASFNFLKNDSIEKHWFWSFCQKRHNPKNPETAFDIESSPYSNSYFSGTSGLISSRKASIGKFRPVEVNSIGKYF